jgi:hypothetical protein
VGLGMTLLFDQYIKYNSLSCLIHLLMPILTLFPMHTSLSKEIVIFKTITSGTSHRIHQIIVITYTLLYTAYLTYTNIIFLGLSILSVPLIYLIYVDSNQAIWFELFYICIFPLYLSYIPTMF